MKKEDFEKALQIEKKIDYYKKLLEIISKEGKAKVIINYSDKDGMNGYDEFIPVTMNNDFIDLWTSKIAELNKQFEEI